MSDNTTRPKNTRKAKTKDNESYGPSTKPNGTYKSYQESPSPHTRSTSHPHKPPPHPNGQTHPSPSPSPSPNLHSSHPNKRPTHPHDPHHPSSSPSPSPSPSTPHAHRPQSGHASSPRPSPSPSSTHSHTHSHSHPPHTQENGSTRRGSRHERTHSGSHSGSHSSPHTSSHSSSYSSPHSGSHSSSHSSPHTSSHPGSHPGSHSGSYSSSHPGSHSHSHSGSHTSSHSRPSTDPDQPFDPNFFAHRAHLQNVQEQSRPCPPETKDLTPSEMESLLHYLWNLAFDRSKNLTIPNHERPVVYRDASNAWGSDSKNAFLSDFDFCTELKKSYISKYGNPAQPGQTTKSDENGKAKNGGHTQTGQTTKSDENGNAKSGGHTQTGQTTKSDENGKAKNSVHSKENGESVNNNDVNRETNNIHNINNTNATNNTNGTNNVNNINTNKIIDNSSNNTNKITHASQTSKNTTDNNNNNKNKNKKNKANGKITNKEQTPDAQKTNPEQKDTKQKEKQEPKKQETKQETKQKEPKQTKQEEITQKDEEKEVSEEKEEEKEEKEEEKEEEKVESEESEDAAYTYDFTNDEYEEIADPADAQKGNPGDVIIDIPDMPDIEYDVPHPTKTAQNGKTAGKPGKNKKAKKGKSKPAAKHHAEPEKEKPEPPKNSLISNANNNNYANSIINLTSNGNNEAWNDILGNLLPRPKAEITKVSGTNNLQIDKIGSYTLEHDNAQAKAALLNGMPREVARVFGNRFGKLNTSGNLALPVKWSSGEGLMTAGRKFPMEVPFLSLKDMFGAAKPTSKLSCANLKCQNTTSEDKPFKTCAKCNMTAYCSRECQVEDWAKRHKQTCKTNAAEEQRKNYATQKFWATASIRHMIFLHWYARYGKGVIVIMCKDFLAFSEDDPNGRDLYVFYVPMADLLSDECPIPALKKCQAEFTKSFVNHDTDSHSIASAAVDSTGFITSQIDEVKVLQLKLHKRSCKEHDLQKVDAIAVDSHNQATLYTFH